MSIEELKRRVSNCEDSLTERKSSGAFNDVIKTVVGFANSVPENRTGVLFVGVNNNGEIIGVENPDKLQKTIRNICENECHPPIWANICALNFDEKTVIAVEVPYSPKKPYFAGQAFVRIGTETKNASEELFNELILHHLEKVKYILRYKNTTWTVVAVGKKLGASANLSNSRYQETAECRIEEVTAHFVRFRILSSDSYVTEELNFINISWDDKSDRPKVVVRYKV